MVIPETPPEALISPLLSKVRAPLTECAPRFKIGSEPMPVCVKACMPGMPVPEVSIHTEPFQNLRVPVTLSIHKSPRPGPMGAEEAVVYFLPETIRLFME